MKILSPLGLLNTCQTNQVSEQLLFMKQLTNQVTE